MKSLFLPRIAFPVRAGTAAVALLIASAGALPLRAASDPAGEGEFHDPFAADEETEQPKVSDPLEKVNRGVYRFNDTLYKWLLRPVAKGYSYVAPKPVRESLDRLFTNLKYPVRGVNNLLEGRVKGAGIETARFVINTTVGIGGLFDPAARWNLKPQPAGFDQTLAVYGVPQGAYLMLPLLGPSTVRGGIGTAGDTALSPTLYLDWPWGVTGSIAGANALNTTSLHVQEIDDLRHATLDPYTALRSAYFQNRAQAR